MKRLFAVLIAALFILAGCLPGIPSEPAGAVQPSSTVQGRFSDTELTPAPTSPGAPPDPSQSPQWKGFPAEKHLIALVRLDGNVWLVDALSGAGKQITLDGNGTPLAGANTFGPQWIYYDNLTWSSDGQLLAFRRTTLDNTASENKIHEDILVYEMEPDQVKVALEQVRANQLAFRPGSHVLAYDEPLDPGYFVTGSGEPDASKARGIQGLNIDTGEASELVRPEHGLWLSEPHWSADGNLLGFVEQKVFEDPAPFALYDFRNNTYISWNKVAGGYDFSPDGQLIAFDTLVNQGFSGSERIWISDLNGQGEQALSPQEGQAAYGPAWSPDGKLLAYKVSASELAPADSGNMLVVQPADSPEMRQLGSIAFWGDLAWSPDGSRLAFTTGPYDQPLAKVVVAADGSDKDLGNGYGLVWQPDGGG